MRTSRETYTERKPRVAYDGGWAYLALGEAETDGGWTYDCLRVRVAGETEEALAAGLRGELLAEIDAYDRSPAVNAFTIDGVELWLDRATRAALMRRFEAERAGGVETTTLWWGSRKFSMPTETAIAALDEIERYACRCFDATAQHKADAAGLDTVEGLLAYDYTAGYPGRVGITTREKQ